MVWFFVFTAHHNDSVRARYIYIVLQAKSPLPSDQSSISASFARKR